MTIIARLTGHFGIRKHLLQAIAFAARGTWDSMTDQTDDASMQRCFRHRVRSDEREQLGHLLGQGSLSSGKSKHYQMFISMIWRTGWGLHLIVLATFSRLCFFIPTLVPTMRPSFPRFGAGRAILSSSHGGL